MGLTRALLLSLTKTPDKMRVLLALTLLVFVTGALAGGKEKQEMMMWMKMKAMEGCLGEKVVKDHMVKMKRSAAKCMHVETPELELPMFDNTFALANVLATKKSLAPGQFMKTFLQMQMLSQMFDQESPRSFNKRAAHHEDEDVLNLGARLHNKLEDKKEEMEAMAGNMTCVLRECGVLNSENHFYPEGIKAEFKEMAIDDEWLKMQLEKYCDQCIQLAEAVPQDMLDDCPWGGEMVKVKYFMKCMMKKKIETCMHFDIRQKLEENFKPIDDLVAETNIPEKQLYEIVKQMLKGPEEMMMSM